MNGGLGWALERAAVVHGDRLAVVDGDEQLTYAELQQRVASLGAGLASLGVVVGDVVGVLSLNSARHLECWLGIPGHGAVLNDLNWRLTVEELAFVVDDSATVALVVDDTHLETGRALRDRCASLRQLVHAGPGPTPDDAVAYASLTAHAPAGLPALADDALAGIFYTGGTTGRSKGVMLTHANLVANAKHVLMAVGHRPDDRYLHCGPMFHLADGSQTYALTWAGGVHVIVPAFEPALVARTIEEQRVTLALIVPTMVNLLVNHPDTAARDLSSLRLVMYGASPMPEDLQRRAMQVLPCGWSQLYGMTEAAPLVTQSTPEDHVRGATGEEPYATRMRSAGAPVIGVQAEVRRADGVPAEVGEVGEVWVRGPNVMQGYWNRPEETAAALTEDGWYRTGDAAWADDHGYLTIVDRVKDMIITGGENVYSAEVESALSGHPAVLEAAVIGVPDERWGERVHAVVVLRAEAAATEAELVDYARRHIAGYKVPRSVQLTTEPLPKSGAGKVLKRDLRQPFWGEGRQVH